MQQDSVNKITLLAVVLFISALFLYILQPFLMTLLLAGIFSALIQPLYKFLCKKFKGKKQLASAVTIIIIFLGVLLPLLGLGSIVVAQAVEVGQSVTPWIKQRLAEPENFSQYLTSLPFYDELLPYQEPILQKAGQAVGAVSKFLVDRLSSVTLGTINFLFLCFVFLYGLFFLLMDGHKLVEKILYYLPLGNDDEQRMLDRFTSVTRATVKGTFLIGILQGVLNGIAFAVAGVPYSVFWGAVMAVLSVIPSVGSALIWMPAAAILLAQGHFVAGGGLLIYCGLVVGSLDNVLRPILVGKDTQMHELMIFFSTLGGIIVFGFVGIIIGPLIASLMITVWEIYGTAFKDVLPEVRIGKQSSSD